MADAAVTVLLENLSHLLISCADLTSGAADELQLLKSDVELLRAFLQDAANQPKYEEPYREIERWIEEVVHEAQDSIDSYLTRATAARAKIDLFRRRRGLNTKPVGSLVEEVRSLREDKLKPMFDKVRADFAHMRLLGEGADPILEEPTHQIKLKKVPLGQNNIVGLDKDLQTIISYLINPTRELDFISIVGMPGLGKTTLARSIYENPEIHYEFPVRIWVYVSSDLNIKDVFLNILKQVTSKDMSNLTDHDLASAVRDYLRNIKFLLVLDDVWHPDAFTAIHDALPRGNVMGKVLITSRFREVGRYANPARNLHTLRFLDIEESWILLRFEVFEELGGCPPELEDIGRDIVRQCGGLPLVIVIIGGILLDQLSKTQSISALRNAWEKVSETMEMYLQHDVEELIEMAVKLSYDRLTVDLRSLFLYLGVFPEDYTIPTTTLTRLWIAEGFIQHYEGKSLEDIAEENLEHLINRKLVIADKLRPNGKVKTCRLHDIVRDFCRSKGSEVNLFREIVRNSGKGLFDPPLSDLQKYRRLCIHSDLLDFFSSEPYVPGVRSFLCFSKTESMLGPGDTSKIPGDAFEMLRVLDIMPIRFTRFPLELTQLFCLSYIVLSSNFKILPEAISMLRNMHTLIIHTTSRTLEIKADIWKMIRLRHLKTNASIILRKEPETHSDQELQRLTHLSPENCTTTVFDRARCLKKLGIRGTLSVLLDGEVGYGNFHNLEKLKDLQNLKLLNDVHVISPSEGRLPSLPPRDKFPPKLRSLTLSATFLSWENMSVLGMLQNLEVLKLKDNAFVGERWEVMDGSFPALQVLQIGYTDLVIWRASGHHFPRLRCLAVRNCEKLEALPQGLASLREIELLRPTKAVAASARRIADEKLQAERNSRIRLSIFFPPDE